MTSLNITVVGTPAPQGSKKAINHRSTGRPIVIESNHAKNRAWRQDVRQAALEAIQAHDGTWLPIEGPVWLEVFFHLPRPQGHYGSGKNAGQLRAAAPAFPGVKPDLDKLLRSTLDALGEAGCWRDDSRVVAVHAEKRYADNVIRPGARIELSALPQTTPPVSGDEAVEAGGVQTVQEALL